MDPGKQLEDKSYYLRADGAVLPHQHSVSMM